MRSRCTRTLFLRFLYFSIFLALIPMSAVTVSAAEQTDEPRRLTVIYSEVKGLSETKEDGTHTGLIFDFLNEISKYTNWEYEFIPTSTETMTDDFLSGSYDLMGGVFYDPSLSELFAFPKYSIGSNDAVLFSRKDDNRMKSYDLSTINGMTIGVYENAREKIRRLKEFISFQGLDCTIKYYTFKDLNDGNLYKHLDNGEIDLLMGNNMEDLSAYHIITSFNAQPFYIVTRPESQDILDGLNTAMEKILDSNPNFPTELYKKHFPDSTTTDIQFTEEDQNYIESSDPIRVAAVREWHPLFCQTQSNDQHNGAIIDLLNRISEISGLTFTYIYVDTYDEAFQLTARGEADMLGCFIGGESDAADQGLVLTHSFFTMNNTIIKNKSVDYPDPGLTAGVLKGRTLPSTIPASGIQYFDNTQDGLQAVNEGTVDFFYGLSTTIEQENQRRRFPNLAPVTLVNNTTDIAFALDRPADTNLLTILNKAIASLSTEETNSIVNQNLVSMGTAMSLKEVIYSNPLAFLGIMAVFLLLVVFAVILTTRFRLKSALMQSELEKLEAESKAKGEFLSRMSHEIRTPMNAISGLSDLTCMMKDVPEEIESNLRKIRSSSRYLLSLINNILDMSKIDSEMLTLNPESFSLRDMLDDLTSMMRVQAEQKDLQFNFNCQLTHEFLMGDSIRLRQVLTNLLSNALKFTPPRGTVALEVHEVSCADQKTVLNFAVKDTGIGIASKDQDSIFGAFEQLGTNESQSEGSGLGLPISQKIVQLMGGELSLNSSPGKGSEFYFTLTFPVASAPEPPQTSVAQHEPVTALEGKHILLAEDNNLNAEIATELMQLKGLVTERAVNGEEALRMFCSSTPGYYQLILMDIKMPIMNGLEATKAIRSCGHPDQDKIPIIALTANSFREDVETAMESGMNGFIPKPFDSNYLFDVISRTIL